jgi:hypothetical protein
MKTIYLLITTKESGRTFYALTDDEETAKANVRINEERGFTSSYIPFAELIPKGLYSII